MPTPPARQVKFEANFEPYIIASKRSLPAPFARWDQTRQAIYADIWSNFWNEERGHFVQYIGSTALDGSMLLMPLVRFVAATGPKAAEVQGVRLEKGTGFVGFCVRRDVGLRRGVLLRGRGARRRRLAARRGRD